MGRGSAVCKGSSRYVSPRNLGKMPAPAGRAILRHAAGYGVRWASFCSRMSGAELAGKLEA